MKNKSLKKNYIYNLMYQIITMILPLVTTPYISRTLGAENIGIYSYTLSISAYFILFGSLGISLYGQREVAYNQGEKNKCSVIFWEIIILRTITMIISLTLYYVIFVNGQQYQLYYKILILELIANCIDISWFFQGIEEFEKTVLRNMVVKLISIISIFIFVKKESDLYIYFFIYVLSLLIGNLSLWLYLPKYLVKIKIGKLHIKRHLKPTLELFIPQIAVQVYTVLDRTMIGTIISDKSEVGFYDQSQKIIKILLTVITSLGTVMMPRIANKFASGEKEKINEYMKKSFNMVFLLAFPMMFGITAVSKAFVPIFFGDGYIKVATLMNVICPIILLIGLSNVTGTQFLLPTKRQKEFTISVIIGAITNFIMNACLIWKFGAVGASIGTVIAEFMVTIVQIYFTRNDFNFREIIKMSKNYIMSSIAMLIVCVFIREKIKNNLISVGVQVTIGIGTYVVCLMIIRDKFIFEIINRFAKKIKKDRVK